MGEFEATNPILVTGGTGTLGRTVVHRLLTAGHQVRVLSRCPRPAQRHPYAWMTGDLRRGEGIDDAVAGVTAIVHCATTYRRADVEATRNRIFVAQRRLPVIMVPAGVSFQPIDVRDVADRLVELAGRPAAGRAPDLGGPQVRPMTELAQAYLQASGRRRLILPVPAAGQVLRGYRAGGHLARERPAGRITFEEFLDTQFIGTNRGGVR